MFEKIHDYLLNTADSMDDLFHLPIGINHLSGYFDENFQFTSLESLLDFINSYILSYVKESEEFVKYEDLKLSIFKDITEIFNNHSNYT